MDGHTLLNARFTDDARTTIQAQWQDNTDPKIIRDQYVMTEDNDVLYKELLRHTTLDDIHEYSINYMRNYRKEYENFVINLAKQEGLIYTGQINPSFFEDIVYTFFTDFKEDDEEQPGQEELFLFKLKLFESDTIKNSKNRSLKSKLRKSKDFLTALKYAIEIAEDNNQKQL